MTDTAPSGAITDALLGPDAFTLARSPIVWTESRLARDYRLVRLLNGELSLQRLVIEHAYNEAGHLCNTRYEWCDIPTVELS